MCRHPRLAPFQMNRVPVATAAAALLPSGSTYLSGLFLVLRPRDPRKHTTMIADDRA